MKINKSRLLALLALGGLATFGTLAKAQETDKPAKPPGDRQAPPPGGPGGGANMKERAAKMAEELGLSDDQKAKVQDAMKEQFEKMRTLNNDSSLSQEDRRAKMKEMRDSLNEKMKSILTAEQYTKWEKMRPAGRGPGGPGGPRGKGKPPGDKPADAPEKD